MGMHPVHTAKGFFINGPLSIASDTLDLVKVMPMSMYDLPGIIRALEYGYNANVALLGAVLHPVDTLKTAWQSAWQSVVDKWNSGPEGQGEIAFHVATLLLSFVKTVQVTKVARVTATVEAAVVAPRVNILVRLRGWGDEAIRLLRGNSCFSADTELVVDIESISETPSTERAALTYVVLAVAGASLLECARRRRARNLRLTALDVIFADDDSDSIASYSYDPTSWLKTV